MEDIFMLRRPTSAPDDLVILFDFQSTMLDALRRHNSDVEHRIGTVPSHVARPFARPLADVMQPALALPTLRQKYVVPPMLQVVALAPGPPMLRNRHPNASCTLFFGSFAVPRV